MYFKNLFRLFLLIVFLQPSCIIIKSRSEHLESNYRLIRIDSTSLEYYNYFEFVKNNNKYKLLSFKFKNDFCADTCKEDFKKHQFYELKIYPLGYYAISDTDLMDLLHFGVYYKSKNIIFGGSSGKVYMSKNICGTKYCKPISK